MYRSVVAFSVATAITVNPTLFDLATGRLPPLGMHGFSLLSSRATVSQRTVGISQSALLESTSTSTSQVVWSIACFVVVLVQSALTLVPYTSRVVRGPSAVSLMLFCGTVDVRLSCLSNRVLYMEYWYAWSTYICEDGVSCLRSGVWYWTCAEGCALQASAPLVHAYTVLIC